MKADLTLVPAMDVLELDIERARDLLSRCSNVDEAKDFRDKAAAVAVYLRKKSAGIEIQNYALEQVLWAGRRMGQLLDEKLADGGRPKNGTEEVPLFLADLGISKNESSRSQKMAQVPEATFVARIERAKADAQRLTADIALGVTNKTKAQSPSIQDRRTPQWLFDALNDRLGPFILDAFADGINHLCDEYYTREDNAYVQLWQDVTFANPEFEDMEAPLKKALEEASRGIRSVVLGPVGCSQAWYHELAIQGTVYIPDMRISYDMPDGTPTNGADRDTIVMAFGGEYGNKKWKHGEFRVRALPLSLPERAR
jgi:phage N-6-adenine-methyltransferase